MYTNYRVSQKDKTGCLLHISGHMDVPNTYFLRKFIFIRKFGLHELFLYQWKKPRFSTPNFQFRTWLQRFIRQYCLPKLIFTMLMYAPSKYLNLWEFWPTKLFHDKSTLKLFPYSTISIFESHIQEMSEKSFITQNLCHIRSHKKLIWSN